MCDWGDVCGTQLMIYNVGSTKKRKGVTTNDHHPNRTAAFQTT